MNRNTLITLAVVVVIAVAGAYALLGRTPAPPSGGNDTPTGENPPPTGSDNNPTPVQPTFRGVSLSPRSYTGNDFTDFFVKARQAGDIITWSGDWAELSDPKGAPYVVAQLARANDLRLVVIAQFFTQGTGELLRPLNDTTKQSYREGAVAFAGEYEPLYMGLGIEINALHEVNPADYAAFKAFFPEVAKAVREVSPGTRVFTVFQLERLRGLRGGLFGGGNDPTVNDWALLGDFPDTDLLAFTTYPCIIYKDPSDIPSDYYTAEIEQHTYKPIAYTEAGWFRVGPAGWESSAEEQARFIALYIDKTKPLEPELLVWSFLYDQEAAEPFASMGLLGKDDSSSPAWEAWLKP
ncbi:TPA: hypothetical protein HA344_06135 [Candidatus Bathyarchaeota archaeon]|nr:hypothetical protein [Candidatus Bathyarchaeota archaeon]